MTQKVLCVLDHILHIFPALGRINHIWFYYEKKIGDVVTVSLLNILIYIF